MIDRTIRINAIALLIGFCCFSLTSLLADSNPWRIVQESSFQQDDMERQIIPQRYLTVAVDHVELQAILAQAPLRFSPESYGKEIVLELPMPNGKMERFQIFDAPIMHPDLAAKYPKIHSYAGVGIDDPTASLRFDVTQFGFHAMVLSGKHSTVFIDPYSKADAQHHISYYKKDFKKEAHFVCGFEGDADMDTATNGVEKVQGDCMFRTYRLALACTGEYANFHGGNKPDVMAAFNTTMTRVNGVYERDLGLTMVLIPNNDTLIFLNAGSDPYTNNNGGTMLGQNQTTCNNLIGFANYDIGHVFSTGGGGIASLNAPCNNNKARGVTGLNSPIGDPFDIDYVAHEMGHQYGANHTQNNSCNRVNATAMEPGSASTIMGYAGICNPNVQNNSDDYFHAISIQEMAQNITFGSGGNCPITVDVGNTPPTVDGGNANYSVPVSTPFRLTAEGFDADGDSLTYCWEQMDNQVAPMPPVSTSTGGPAFRSYVPVNEPYRYFPKLTDVVNEIDDPWEELPTVSRNMRFRVTVRDNNMGVGCTEEDNLQLNFTTNAGPFLVQHPNTSDIEWFPGESKTVNWDVAGTDAAPVSCENVDILLSSDGGLTYPDTLAVNVPNTGTADIIVPFVNSTFCRVMVFCSDNVFYDISDENFTITVPPYPLFVGTVSPGSQEVCGSVDSVVYQLTYTSLLGFAEVVSFNATGVPMGATATFSQDTLTPSGTISLTIGNLANIASGDYTINVVGIGDTITVEQEMMLSVTNGIPTATQLTAPADGATSTPLTIELTWESVALATEYIVEVATSPAFGNSIIESSVSGTNSYQPANLVVSTIYYWRVRSKNICGENDDPPLASFQTGFETCLTLSSSDTPTDIPTTAGTTTSIISFDDNGVIADINLDMEIPHTWVGHLSAALISPTGPSVALFDRPGFPNGPTTEGCRQDNMLISFDDDALNSPEDLEDMCNPFFEPYAVVGDFRPLEPLAGLVGLSTFGDWTLAITDAVDDQEGTINYWNMEICYSKDAGTAPNFAKLDLVVPSGGTEPVTENNLFAISSISTASQINYTLLSLPANGTLTVNGTDAAIGTIFSQEDINNDLVTYTNTNPSSTSDQFRFDVVTNTGGWIQNETLNIIIGQDTLLTTAIQSLELNCTNSNNAQVTVLVSGSNPPFSFSNNGGVGFGPNPVFTNMDAGDYTFHVQDANGTIVQTDVITIVGPPALMVSTDVTDNNLTVNATGGTGNLMYSLNGTDFQTSNLFPNLANNTYTVTVRDENDCLATSTITIDFTNLNELDFDLVFSLFPNPTDGQMTLVLDQPTGRQLTLRIFDVTGRIAQELFIEKTGPYWQQSFDMEQLPAGSYEVLLTDGELFGRKRFVKM